MRAPVILAALRAPVILPALLAVLAGPAAALCEGYVPGPKPQNADRDIVGQDYDEIVARGYIDLAVYDDFAPYSWRENGRPRGVDIELGRIVAETLGVEPRFDFVVAAENLDADLREHVWRGATIGRRVSNVMLHVPYDPELTCRIEQVVLTGQYYNESIAIAYRRAAYPDGPPLPAYFRFETVGVENDSIADFYLSALAGGQLAPNIRRYPTPAAAMAALSAGEVTAVMGARAQLERGLTDGLALHTPPLPGLAADSWTVGVAVSQSFRQLAYAVDDAIRAAVEDGRVAAIFAGFGLSYAPPEW
jgi:ABC-type amino acid transport substrate-binding protein